MFDYSPAIKNNFKVFNNAGFLIDHPTDPNVWIVATFEMDRPVLEPIPGWKRTYQYVFNSTKYQ